ncbi:hypothetical protein BDV30DRAFT_208375 [Aspergillus minisclerotigenes]|uniref:Uncharacterized protein n=1 Tax=Aspergillus minisclerotigenes TaxID=656917 RepID=A0A5N6J980_9EURO|nr:hypothetical protein BDV30DRAFT_208375 [Aspergillus minisclerotigenes]
MASANPWRLGWGWGSMYPTYGLYLKAIKRGCRRYLKLLRKFNHTFAIPLTLMS